MKKTILILFLLLLAVPVFGRINLITPSDLRAPNFIQGLPACSICLKVYWGIEEASNCCKKQKEAITVKEFKD